MKNCDEIIEANEKKFEAAKLERLRDEFAMAALVGMIHCEYGHKVDGGQWATDAYSVADQMLKAREQSK